MLKFHRMLCLLLGLILCLPLAISAGAAENAARSWEIYPDSDRQVSAEDVNAFFAALTAETVDSLQMVFVTPRGEAEPALALPPVRLDPAGYPQLIAQMKALRLFAPKKTNPYTGDGAGCYLAVTTKDATLKLALWNSSSRRVRGTLGWTESLEIGSAAQPESAAGNAALKKLEDTLAALPAVQRAREKADERAAEDALAAIWREIGLQQMNDPDIPLQPDNPPALAVAAENVAEYNLFQDGYWAAVTEPADQKRLLSLVNSTVVSWHEPKAAIRQGGKLQLQLRMQDDTRHEYQTARSTYTLLADGKAYNDPYTAIIFDEQLGEILSRYPAGIAWLGSMNPKNVTSMQVLSGGSEQRYARSQDKGESAALEAAIARLRALRLHGGVSRTFPRGSLPQELRGQSASHQLVLRFANDILYHLDFYPGKMLTVSSSDMSYSYFYRYERISQDG